jgi:hypothetical protein
LNLQTRPLVRRAVNLDRTTQRVDAIGQPEKAGTRTDVSTSRSVIAHDQVSHEVAQLKFDGDGARPGVLQCIRERFRGHVVDTYLDLLRRPRQSSDAEFDRNQ